MLMDNGATYDVRIKSDVMEVLNVVSKMGGSMDVG